jgi:DNA-binding winged helix-turn-helix (wHTH) protein/TolB-like protein/Tfp pilus assembly protein PilF
MPTRLVYLFGDFRLDPTERVLFRGDRPVPLTPKAVETLLALVERHGRLVTKEELLRIVWPDAFVEENNLAQHISVLRRALGDSDGAAPYIETVPKRGYRFTGGVVKQVEGDGDRPAENASSMVTPAPQVDPALAASVKTHPQPARIWAALAGLAVLVLAAGLWQWNQPSGATAPPSADQPGQAGVTRVAVLPFVNLGSQGDEAFVAGLTEEVASRLAGLSGLAVSSTTTVAAYDRRGKSLHQLGADLDVDYVIEGSVRWAQAAGPPRIRITPKVIRAADDTVVWTEPYDASLSDLIAVQAEIAQRIAGALEVALDARERRAVSARPTVDGEAYLAYIRGLASYQLGSSDTANLALARSEMEQAIARDPRFALAWSWVARVYASQYRTGSQRSAGTLQAAYRAAQTAIDLEPGLPEAHLGLALVLASDRQFERARQELDIARLGLPNSAELWQTIAFIDQRHGRWSESLAAYMRAFEIDPATTADLIAVHYLHLREYADSRRFVGIARAANRTGIVVPDAWGRFSESGEVAAARTLLESALRTRTPVDGRVRALLARFEWFDGRHQRALELIEAMDPAGAWLSPNLRYPASLAAAQVYEDMGRKAEASTRYAAAMAELERRQRSAPDDYQIEAAMGLAAAGLGRAAEAIRHGERAVELLPVTKDAAEGPLYLYLLAQIQSRVGQQTAAFATLDRMFSNPGFYNEWWVARDPGLAALRSHPSYRDHLDRWARSRGEALLVARGSATPEQR